MAVERDGARACPDRVGPAGERPGEEENRRRQAALEADLCRLAGVVLWPATGVDPLTGHREEGVAVCGVSTADVVRLGGRYGQEAIFVWTPDEWAVLACSGGRRVTFGWSLGPRCPAVERTLTLLRVT